jgi:hypothetical protein
MDQPGIGQMVHQLVAVKRPVDFRVGTSANAV